MKTLIVILIAISTVACSTSEASGRTLHFTGRDEPEANFRTRVQGLKTTPEWAATCAGIRGKPIQEAKAVLAAAPESPVQHYVEIGAIYASRLATARPGQQADDADLLRAAEIVVEECASSSPPR